MVPKYKGEIGTGDAFQRGEIGKKEVVLGHKKVQNLARQVALDLMASQIIPFWLLFISPGSLAWQCHLHHPRW